MKNYEKNLEEVWKEVQNQIVITFKDITKIEESFAKAFQKIQQQREELIISRDIWKNKFNTLKGK